MALSDAAREAVRASRRVVDAAVARGDVVYGVNTGFGNFADVRIPPTSCASCSRTSCARTPPASAPPLGRARDPRADAAARQRARQGLLRRARSRPLELLVALLNRGVHPRVPAQGSVGASGDLAPLAHLALALIGEGECELDGRRDARRRGAARRGPHAASTLEAKEGLALINGTQLMTAVGGPRAARRRARSRAPPTSSARSSLEALHGHRRRVRPAHPRRAPAPGPGRVGRATCARCSPTARMRESHRDCGTRAGRLLAALHAAGARRRARRARPTCARTHRDRDERATDNPLVFAETRRDPLRRQLPRPAGGASPPTSLAIAAAELGDISERRIEHLVNPALSGLPAVPRAATAACTRAS